MGTTTSGLEGVVAGESELCYIDGYRGILSYRGYNIHTLAENAIFEEVVFLLWNGWLPKQPELDRLKRDLVAARPLPSRVVDFLKTVPPTANPMDVLRTAVSMLGMLDPEEPDTSPEANRRKCVRLMSQTATITATYNRLRQHLPPVDDDPALGFAANFLYTLTGKRPDDVMEHAFDVALILHADHEFNASTFAARVTAATLSDIYSAIVAGIGALKGPLHGGANRDVITWLLGLDDEEAAVQGVRDALARKEKLPGFGHRVYRTEDPRTTHLRALSEELGKRTGFEKLYRLSKRMEEVAKSIKDLNPNVDFYSGSMYYSLGIPIDLYTAIFAISRMSGWTAHMLEQYRNNRLIRPRAEYKGNPDGQPWVPISSR
jgi:citrate synthase